MSARLDRIREINLALEKEGLTPFDLCSWLTLLQLTDRLGDLDYTVEVRAQLEAAIYRKADDLDAEQDSNFYRAILGPRAN